MNRPGAFAEYLALPMTNVWHHDPAIPRDVQSIFDPLGNAVHTALSFPVLGRGRADHRRRPDRHHGGGRRPARRRPLRRHHRRESLPPGAGQESGAHARARRPQESIADAQKKLGMKEGFDVGLEMSGNPHAFRDMLANMCHGGKIAMLGIPEQEMAIDWNTVIFNMLTIKGIYGREMYETWYKMTVMIQGGLDIEPVITHRFHYTEFEQGFEVMRSGKSGKVVLTWKEESLMFGSHQTAPGRTSSQEIRDAGLFKGERVITTPQRARVGVVERDEVLNLCANNYLGLADHPEVVAAAQEALDRWGYGLASVRFICGTQQIHKQLERRTRRVPRHRGHDPLLLLLRRQRRPVRDAARPGRRRSSPTSSTTPASSTASGSARPSGSATRTTTWPTWSSNSSRRPRRRFRVIATDGVFSMDGIIANLPGICDLADQYDALVMVDDSHAVGFMGTDRPRHARVSRRDGPRRHPHRHAGQGPRRRQRRLHQRPPGDHRPAPPAEPALPVLQHRRPADRRRLDEGARTALPVDGAARPARSQHPSLPRRA